MAHYNYETGKHDEELASVLLEISRVAHRMAGNIRHLVAQRKAEEGESYREDERNAADHRRSACCRRCGY